MGLFVCNKLARHQAVGIYYIPWPAKKLLPKIRPQVCLPKIAKNCDAPTTNWTMLPKNKLQKSIQYSSLYFFLYVCGQKSTSTRVLVLLFRKCLFAKNNKHLLHTHTRTHAHTRTHTHTHAHTRTHTHTHARTRTILSM